MLGFSPLSIAIRSKLAQHGRLAEHVQPLPPFMRGINLAGAEFGAETQAGVPGSPGTDYFWPTDSLVDYYLGKGMNVVRLPVLWERLQPTMLVGLHEPAMAELDRIVTRVTSAGAALVIDLHNHMRRWVNGERTLVGTGIVTRDTLGDFWRRMAIRYKENPLVIFGLMNEPNSEPGSPLSDADNVAIQNEAAAEIRATRAKNLILFSPGRSSGMYQFSAGDSAYNTVHLGFLDPGRNSAWDVHQYFDAEYQGTSPEPWIETEENRASSKVRQFVDFARENGLKAFYGEFNTGSSGASKAELHAVLDTVEAADDVFIGWCWWAGGGHWPDDAFYSLDPLDGRDRVQLGWLRKYADPAYVPLNPSPTIAITSGSGYAGSTITVTNGGTGNWQVDSTEGDDWADLPGATSPEYVQTVRSEGLPLRWQRDDGVVSNAIHMWMPNDLASPYINPADASWVDFKRADLLTLDAGKIASAPDLFGSGRTFAQSTAGNRPESMVVDGYAAAVWPDTDNNVELTASGKWAPAFVMLAGRYRAGTQTTFASYETLFADPTSATVHRVMGQANTATLFLDRAKIWTSGARKDGAPASATILPLPRSIVSFSGEPASALWSIGGRNGGSMNRGWKGPLWEIVCLAAIPTGDAFDRLAACLAHRHGTIAALATHQPANPYLSEGPRVA